jgi:phosphoribosyl-ATP pyrophosphohydrolase/phosphoribosyl-AMP cyclohydrolase
MAIDAGALFARLKPDDRGLVVCVVAHAHTGQVLMVGYMNADALEATLSRRRVTFFSRSRQMLWEKGETSGNALELHDLRIDCDADAILVRAIPRGPTCHTGTTSCFFVRVEDGEAGELPHDDGPPAAVDLMFQRVFEVILDRQAGRGMTNEDRGSYVRRLLDGGPAKLSEKILEEAGELSQAIAAEPASNVAAEAADLFFHAMVGLAHRGVGLEAVADVFARRFGTSGIDEKRARGQVAGD